MIIRNLDANHDWEFGNGFSNFVTQNQAIGLNIETRLLSWVNDCFFDLAAGIDWLNMLGSRGKKQMLDINCRRLILQSYGVTSLVSLSVDLTPDRKFNASYTINTIFSKNYQNSLQQNLDNMITSGG